MTASGSNRPRHKWRWLLTGVVLGLLLSGWFWRGKASSLMHTTARRLRRPPVKRPALIINRWSGGGKAGDVDLAAAARRRGVRVIMLEKGDDLTQLARDAIEAGADTVGMAGGDGSLGLVAGVAIDCGVPFFCIPVGTRNHFALDLGLDRKDPLAALEALDGDELAVDYATVNGRVFLNNVSLGIYAAAVHQEGYREAKAETISRVAREAAEEPATEPALRFATPDGKQHDRAPVVLVSNNPYLFTGPPDFGRRRGLDAGQLGVTAVTSISGTLDLAAEFVVELPNHHQWETSTFIVESDGPIQAGVDGEALEFTSPLSLDIRAGSLRILVPAGTRPGYMPLPEAIVGRLRDLLHLGGDDDTEQT